MNANELKAYIEDHIDPNAILSHQVESGEFTAENVADYDWDNEVAEMDKAFREDGGCGITADQLREYVEMLIAEHEATEH